MVQPVIDILPHLLQWCMQYHATSILDCIITALDYMYICVCGRPQCVNWWELIYCIMSVCACIYMFLLNYSMSCMKRQHPFIFLSSDGEHHRRTGSLSKRAESAGKSYIYYIVYMLRTCSSHEILTWWLMRVHVKPYVIATQNWISSVRPWRISF